MLVLICRGPMGAGMEETYQLTSALKYLPFGKHVALLTDARFSGVSTGACIGHVSPEALAGGPIGKLRDGDLIEIVIDRAHARRHGQFRRRRRRRRRRRGRRADSRSAGRRAPTSRPIRRLPDDTRLWAALQDVSGGTWGGSVFDVDAILQGARGGQEGAAVVKDAADAVTKRCPTIAERATLIGRVWLPDAGGPAPVVRPRRRRLRSVGGRRDLRADC